MYIHRGISTFGAFILESLPLQISNTSCKYPAMLIVASFSFLYMYTVHFVLSQTRSSNYG